MDSINGVGLNFDEADVTAFQDAVKNALPDTPECVIEIEGPFDTSAAASRAASGSAPVLSGSHTVLKDIAGVGTPLSMDIHFGIRHAWETGEPTFGITSSPTVGFLCTQYTVDAENMKYKAKFVVMGTTAPSWSTSAFT